METKQTTPENAEDKSDQTSTKACSMLFSESTENSFSFCGFENMFKKVLEVEDQFLCPEVQAQVGDEYYSKVKKIFERFQQKLRQVIVEAKCKRASTMYELTTYDMYSEH